MATQNPALQAGPQGALDAVRDYLKNGEVVKPLTGKIDKGLQDMIFNLLDFGIY